MFYLTFGLCACNSTVNKHEKKIVKSEVSDSTLFTQSDTIEIINEEEQNNECVRGQAVPIIQKEDYPNTTFVLQPDSITAIETVNFDNGEKLIIRNWGCEYYVLTFRFETSKYQEDITNLVFWFRAAHGLMTNMLGALDEPIGIKKGLVYLENYILNDEKNSFRNLHLGEEIDFGGDDLRSFLSVDSIEKMEDKKFGVTISFSTGPL